MIRKIITILIFLTLSLFSIEVVDGFDYPFSNRGYKEDATTKVKKEIVIKEHISELYTYKKWKTALCKELNKNLEKNLIYTQFEKYKGCIHKQYSRWNNAKPKDTETWYNANDVGSYYRNMKGLHPGEDWNLKGNQHINKPIYAIANGEISGIVDKDTDYETIIIKHKLPNIEGNLYSIYTHVTILKDIVNKFKKKDLSISRGVQIATIKKTKKQKVIPPHLHFAMVYTKQKFAYLKYARMGYYTNLQKKPFLPNPSIEKLKDAFKLLKFIGHLDPSDFIEEHRPSTAQTKASYIKTINNHLSVGKLDMSDFNFFNFKNDGTLDYTIKDGKETFQSGANINKIWKLENVGIETWDNTYYLQYVGKEKGAYFDALRKRKFYLSKSILPNTEGLISINIEANKGMNNRPISFRLFNNHDKVVKHLTSFNKNKINFLVNIKNGAKGSNECFPDVYSYTTYKDDICKIKKAGYTDGDNNGKYNPTNTIQRGEVMKILMKSKYSKKEIEKYKNTQSKFTDVPTTQFYNKYINLAVKEGIVSTDNKEFRLTDGVSFIEASKWTYRILIDKNRLNSSGDWWIPYIQKLKERGVTIVKKSEYKDSIDRAYMAHIISKMKGLK